MATADVTDLIEKLSECAVLAEPTDLPMLADMHGHFETLAEWGEKAGRKRASACATAAASLVECVILEEAGDAKVALEIVGRAVSALQLAVAGDRNDDEIDYPAELDTGEPSASPGFAVTLPSYVDESIFSEFLSRQDSGLDEMESMVLALESGANEEEFGALKRYLHTLKGESAMLGLDQVEKLCHAAEDTMLEVTQAQMVDPLLALRDWLRRAFDAYAGRGAAPEGPEALLEEFGRLRCPAEEQTTSKAPPVTPAPEAPAPVTPAPVTPAPVAASSPAPADELLHFEPGPLRGDRELIADFITEAMEHLDNSDVQLLTLETDPDNEEAVNAVFRAFHTIKGVAGFIALDEVKALAHEAESLLDQVRKRAVVLEGHRIDLVFSAVDTLKHCVDNVRVALDNNSDLMPTNGLPELVANLKATIRGEVPSGVSPAAPMKLGDILVADEAVSEESLNRALEEQKTEIAPPRLGAVLVEHSIISTKQLVAAIEEQKKEGGERKLGEVLVGMGMVTEEQITHALENQQKPPERLRLGQVLVQSGAADPRDIAAALRKQQGKDVGMAVKVREAVKVDANRLDQLVDTVGELVIAETMVTQSPELLHGASTDLARHVSELDKITRELQEMATSLRMVPVRATFQKMARLARDLSKKSEKPVAFTMSGEDTELDKSVVDKIGDPLVHMIRNAVDHGLESSPEARVEAGKPTTGKVHLRAYHKGGNIHIEIEDDGRGLNRDAILRKAVERGIIRESEQLNDREVWNLIFEPGFSTASKVTEVSGRGVGMDVVKRNIEALRGQVDIQSESGKGTVFTIRLPLTLAIIDGMVIRVGAERFILPTLSIVVSLRPSPQDLSTVSGRGEMVKLRGRLLPLFHIHEMFQVKGAVKDPTEGTVVVVESDAKLVALLIDEIIGQQQIVIKPLGEALRDLPGIAGGAIMPDGRVGLILDTAGLVRIATEG